MSGEGPISDLRLLRLLRLLRENDDLAKRRFLKLLFSLLRLLCLLRPSPGLLHSEFEIDSLNGEGLLQVFSNRKRDPRKTTIWKGTVFASPRSSPPFSGSSPLYEARVSQQINLQCYILYAISEMASS